MSQSLSVTYPPSSHPIFHIQDIMDEIFQWVPTASLPSLARVGKVWFRSAVPTIWAQVKLVEALSPFGATIMGGRHGLTAPPTRAHWIRFMLYAPFVREVTVSTKDAFILEAVSRSRPATVQYLFPNAQSLNWTFEPGITRFDILIPQSLRRLRLSTRCLPLSLLAAFYSAIITSRAALEDLELDFISLEHLSDGTQLFNRFLPVLSKTLKRIKIPPTLGTPAVLDSLYKFSSLSTLCVSYFADVPFVPDFPSISTCHGTTQKGGFDYLQHLSFNGPQELLFTAVLDRCSLFHLKQLNLKFDMHGHDGDLVLRAIAQSCPQLEELDLSVNRPTFTTHDNSSLACVAYSSVKPLLGCQNLVSLTLNSFAVSMNTAQLIEVLASRTSWEKITIYTEEPLQFNHLLLFAEFCPKLTVLSLFVDGSMGPDSIPNLPLRATFPALCYIDFRHSIPSARNASRIARFLAKVCEIPPVIWGTETRYWDAISLRIGNFYLHDHLSTGTPVPRRIQRYISGNVNIYQTMKQADVSMGFEMGYEDVGDGDDMEDDDAGNDVELILQRLTGWLRLNGDLDIFGDFENGTMDYMQMMDM